MTFSTILFSFPTSSPPLPAAAAAVGTLHALDALRARRASILDTQCRRVLVPSGSSFGGGDVELGPPSAAGTLRAAHSLGTRWGRTGTMLMVPGSGAAAAAAGALASSVSELPRAAGMTARCDGAGPTDGVRGARGRARAAAERGTLGVPGTVVDVCSAERARKRSRQDTKMKRECGGRQAESAPKYSATPLGSRASGGPTPVSQLAVLEKSFWSSAQSSTHCRRSCACRRQPIAARRPEQAGG
ncbi:hypothetical protein DFH11DRAFT_1549883 [Phellopilus nigrolimitatus]|nr:hypothetical protein DFH11DRAFT_1549883 [Phellopilus nigrolimitatus]